MENYNSLINFNPAMAWITLPLLTSLVLDIVGIVALVYLIKALKLYIKNNSNLK